MVSPSFAIQTTGLRKAFGDNVAVRGLTLEVPAGEVFGFLGPNGAGKTTSIKMLLGLVAPTAGTGQVLGAPVGDRAARTQVGFLPEHFRFHDWLTAEEFLTLHGRLYNMPAPRLRARLSDLLERVGLMSFRRKTLRTFSKGMLQRIGLAQALINDPALVFLDEPTSGLDPVGRRLVRDIIRDLRARGTTVFLNSHLLSEVEITCDRVAFIKHGEVVHLSPLKTLLEGETRVTVRAGRLTPEILAGLAGLGRDMRADGSQVTLTIEGEAALPGLARYLVEQGAELYALTPQRLALEDLFIQIVGTDGGL
ncbi:MAG: ABC transporter ATP-binding protein [Anaerolineales bacterium]|nr:ABC transporter ATP-binding protein [Anaerolineales bacterium]